MAEPDLPSPAGQPAGTGRPEQADAGHPDPTERYEIIGRIADGAMGQVYLTRHTSETGPRHLVLKRIRPELQTDPEMVLMFQDEARIAAQMKHPNIVQLFEVGVLDGSLFLAMELVEGVTLEHLLATLVERRHFIPVELALTIAIGALDALDFAHRFAGEDGQPLNIVHRDVSPQNLMITYSGEVKLLDFGITRAEGRLHQTLPGLLKGKLAYMAPETVEGRRIDARADLFSLGAVLYELLLLKHPFFGSTDAMVLRSIVEEPPVHPRELDPEFPEPVAQLLLDALAKDPDHRIASARDMRARISGYLVETSTPSTASIEALGHFLRDLYRERIEIHEHAKEVGDDAMMLQALRGFVRRASQRASADGGRGSASTGPYALPHSATDLNYARVPTADLPVIRRADEPIAQRSSLDDIFEELDNQTAGSARRALDSSLGRYQLLDVVEQSARRQLQRARLLGPLGFTKEVLLHRLPADRTKDPHWIAALVREAKVRADLNHPHIEALVDFGDQPEAFFAVEPHKGWHLDHALASAARGHRNPPPLEVILRLILDIADALEYLHSLPVPFLHRSVEPSAIVLHHSGRAKLSGFDISAPISERAPYSGEARRASPDRLAPEIIAPGNAAESLTTDVYGLAMVAVECLTLTRPFLRDDAEVTAQAILHGVDDSVLATVPRDVRSVIRRAVAADPAKRFPDIPTLCRALIAVAPVAERAIVRDWFVGR